MVEFRDSPIKWIEAHPAFTGAAVAILLAAAGGIWGLLRNDQPQPPPQTNITQNAPGVIVNRAGGNVTVSTGLSSGDIAKIIEAATKGAGANQDAAFRSLSAELNRAHQSQAFTEQAIRSFFDTLGKKNVPIENFPALLNEIANGHLDTLKRLSELETKTRSDANDENAAAKIDGAREAVSEGRLADADGLLAEALSEEQDRLAKEEKRTKRRRTAIADLIAERAGIALLALNYQEAAKFYSKSADATPAQNKRTKALRYLFAGDAHRKKGSLKPGRAAHEQAMKIFQGLAGDNPSNAQTQRDLTVSYGRIGDISADQGALENYRKSLA
ncbi:MAG: hypothetical protein JKY68_05535, partial [Rhodospirillales bacterium]|nr:hypothetical protein [Rhodospirillales bacterium]